MPPCPRVLLCLSSHVSTDLRRCDSCDVRVCGREAVGSPDTGGVCCRGPQPPAQPLRRGCFLGTPCDVFTRPSSPVSVSAQFRYKKRVYKQANLDEKQLAKLHTKVGGGGWHTALRLTRGVTVSADRGAPWSSGSSSWEATTTAPASGRGRDVQVPRGASSAHTPRPARLLRGRGAPQSGGSWDRRA